MVAVKPPAPLAVAVPTVVVPSRIATVAPGVAVPVNITEELVVLNPEAGDVIVGALSMTLKLVAVLADAVKFVSPPYEALRLWFPAPNDEVLKVAVAALFRVVVPSEVVPSRKVTIPVGPVGVDEPGATTVTVAVSVTVWPKLEGLGDALKPVVVAAGFTI
jgi:hypothetical protein